MKKIVRTFEFTWEERTSIEVDRRLLSVVENEPLETIEVEPKDQNPEDAVTTTGADEGDVR